MVRKGSTKLSLGAGNNDSAIRICFVAIGKASDIVPSRHEYANELVSKANSCLANVAGGVGDLHKMSLASTICSDKDIDAGRRLEIERFECCESLQFHCLDHDFYSLAQVSA